MSVRIVWNIEITSYIIILNNTKNIILLLSLTDISFFINSNSLCIILFS